MPPGAAPALALPVVDDYVQLALMSPDKKVDRSAELVLEKIDLDSPSANRIDGHIKLFFSRYHHTELQLQFLRPFLSHMPSGATPTHENRGACLLPFSYSSTRRQLDWAQ